MADWKLIDHAPKDGTHIQVRIPGHGDDNIVAWLTDTIEGENGPCGCWVFVSDQEPPADWSDGYCWAINEDGDRSTWPTHWKPTSEQPPMTAVDHAELKRLAEQGVRLAKGPYTAKGVYRHSVVLELLSEIEGLKAERDEARAGRSIIAGGSMDMAVMYASANERADAAEDSLRTQAPDSWRPIETAPKDGTEILIYQDGWQEAPRAKWGDHDGEDEDDKPTVFGGWFLASEWYTHGVEDGFLGWNEDIQDGAMPTHWMPLPLRPQTAESGK